MGIATSLQQVTVVDQTAKSSIKIETWMVSSLLLVSHCNFGLLHRKNKYCARNVAPKCCCWWWWCGIANFKMVRPKTAYEERLLDTGCIYIMISQLQEVENGQCNLNWVVTCDSVVCGIIQSISQNPSLLGVRLTEWLPINVQDWFNSSSWRVHSWKYCQNRMYIVW